MNFTSAPAFAASSCSLRSKNHVELAIGYAFSPSGFVMDTRKSVLGPIACIAPAAAAVMLSSAGVMNLPALLRTLPAGSLLRSEEHTSELQSRLHLVCRLLL